MAEAAVIQTAAQADGKHAFKALQNEIILTRKLNCNTCNCLTEGHSQYLLGLVKC